MNNNLRQLSLCIHSPLHSHTHQQKSHKLCLPAKRVDQNWPLVCLSLFFVRCLMTQKGSRFLYQFLLKITKQLVFRSHSRRLLSGGTQILCYRPLKICEHSRRCDVASARNSVNVNFLALFIWRPRRKLVLPWWCLIFSL